ncbi:MAG: leucyl aminopeptidase [Neomegalonema sp.]|nr:leucyl aminopeptidase [Neomegalonema sp.]
MLEKIQVKKSDAGDALKGVDCLLMIGGEKSGFDVSLKGVTVEPSACWQAAQREKDPVKDFMIAGADKPVAIHCLPLKKQGETDYQRIGAAAGTRLRAKPYGSVVLALGDDLEIDKDAVAALLRGLIIAAEPKLSYKKDDKAAKPDDIELTVLHGNDALSFTKKQLKPVLETARAVLIARTLTAMPANHLGPEEFKDYCLGLEDDTLGVRVLDRKELTKQGFRGLLAVAQGSEQPAYVVELFDKRAKGKPDVSLIGKGVCFDSGGLSLKPATSMPEMNMDMAGAATVVGAMWLLTRAAKPVGYVGSIGLVENMPSGTAYRPGDVLEMRSGKTVEILNTDAEGRLVLADVLDWSAKEHEPKVLIDFATLTGAIIIGLGHDDAGLFSNSDGLSEALLSAAKAADEGMWRLPLHDSHRKAIESQVADIKQTGGRASGSATAATFLGEFVGDRPWAHLDIAGVAFTDKDTVYSPSGATGWGVMMLERLVETLSAGKVGVDKD